MSELNLENRPEGCQAAVVYGGYMFLPNGAESPTATTGVLGDKREKQMEVLAVCGDRSFSFRRRDLAVNGWKVIETETLAPDAEKLLGAMCLNCPNRQQPADS